ncbi:molybdenum cofactor biosynthesis protein MoaE [Acetobacteraceae bacterium]|nr:molybdenum cofactor biosynthesis protein MoaE [Acetobacteraceae bacterium]
MKEEGFFLSSTPVDVTKWAKVLHKPEAGGYCAFEGWVRNHNEGQDVEGLEYEIYEVLAQKEGEKIIQEALEKFDIIGVSACHRYGNLKIGDMAVWVGASAAHRDDAFKACRYVIDAIKFRVPVWKKEHYKSGEHKWVACHHCAAAGNDADHAHHHGHGAGCNHNH